MKRILIFLSFILISLSSCTGKSAVVETKSEKEHMDIAVFLYRNDDHFINTLKEAIEETAVKNEKDWGKGTYSFTYFNGKNQNEIQINQIKEAISSGADVLAINIVERGSAKKIIDMAKEADVPIVFFNRQPIDVDMARWDKLYYVGLDGIQSGEMQGEIVADYWNEHPEMDKNGDGILQYIMLQGQYNHQDTILRTKYSIETIKKAGIAVEELAKETANWQRLEADSIITTLLGVYGDRIELIISNNDMMALGAKDAIARRDKEVYIPTVGVDGTSPAIEALEKGELIGTVFNDAKKQGEMVARLSYYLAKGIDPASDLENLESGTYYWIDYEKIEAKKEVVLPVTQKSKIEDVSAQNIEESSETD